MDITHLKYFVDQADEKTTKRSMKIILNGLEEIFRLSNVSDNYKIEKLLEKAEKELRINI